MLNGKLSSRFDTLLAAKTHIFARFLRKGEEDLFPESLRRRTEIHSQ